MVEVLVWVLVVGIGIFTLAVMVVVFDAAVEARKYYERKNREYASRPLPR